MFHRETTSYFRFRNLVRNASRLTLETIPTPRQFYSQVWWSPLTIYRYQPRDECNIRELGVHPSRGDISGGDLLPAQEDSSKSNTCFSLSTISKHNTTAKSLFTTWSPCKLGWSVSLSVCLPIFNALGLIEIFVFMLRNCEKRDEEMDICEQHS